ncbi:SAM-dependent methyltransferase [Sphingomonas sp.]|uniref:SAM-dependent methyltransferase n=1 Tax=Sphingomonas sp. TaxID=28214 RepID=UPI003B3B18F2
MQQDAIAAPHPRIDPFAYWPQARSALPGLGGERDPPRPGYAFHTLYIAAGAGPNRFTIAFDGLSATSGVLDLRLQELHETERSSRVLRRIRAPLRALKAQAGWLEVAFTAEAGASYALHGRLSGAHDARADGLTVSLDSWADGVRQTARLQDARSRIFAPPSRVGAPFWARSGPLERAGMIIRRPATIAEPISQMCTAAQFDEPAYAAWRERMRFPLHNHRKQWEFVYILQALERHGALRPGSRGLGFGVGAESLPAFFASLGCEIVATDLPETDQEAASWRGTGQHADTLAGLSRPDLCTEDDFFRRVSFRAVDMTHIPPDLTGFDFCWSACAYEHLGSIAAGLRFVKESIRRLRPGGIAVHTSELNLTSNTRTVDRGPTVLFRRKDMERLALDLIREGHEVAPITYDMGDRPVDEHVDLPPYLDAEHLKVALRQYVTTSFGIIVRRG